MATHRPANVAGPPSYDESRYLSAVKKSEESLSQPNK